MLIRWFGTASISIESDDARILFDPFIPLRGSSVPISAAHFRAFPNILLTHGHFDHIASLPLLCAQQPRMIYATPAAVASMRRIHVPNACIHGIQSGETLRFGAISATAYPGRHAHFDHRLVLSTVFNQRMLRHIANLPQILLRLSVCRGRNETQAYLVEAEGKRILLLGSLNLDPAIDYPKDVDLLILPYQGVSALCPFALQIVDRIRPKRVFLDHFDDGFPPLSCHIDTADIRRALSGKIPVLEPEYARAYSLEEIDENG